MIHRSTLVFLVSNAACFAYMGLVNSSNANAAGYVHNENFIIYTPSDTSAEVSHQFANRVLAKAEEYRKQIAKEWVGQKLPPSVGRTVINVKLSDAEDKGLTWAIDDPRRTLHTIYLTTSRERAIGSTLKHEITHVVLATQFPHPNRLPAWLEEGIASRYDDDARIATRQSILNWYARTRNWPKLQRVLTADRIIDDDKTAYAVSSSLVNYLLTRADKAELLRFGHAGARHGWKQALAKHYQIEGVEQLQQSWQKWVAASNSLATLARR